MMVVRYKYERARWYAIALPHGRFAVCPPKGETLATIKQFEADLKAYLYKKEKRK